MNYLILISSYDHGCHFWSLDGSTCYLGSLGYERILVATMPSTDVYLMKGRTVNVTISKQSFHTTYIFRFNEKKVSDLVKQFL